MKVSELIQILQSYPQDLLIVVDGYEGGLTELDCKEIKTVEAQMNYHRPEDWFYGPHQQVFLQPEEGFEIQTLLLLGR